MKCFGNFQVFTQKSGGHSSLAMASVCRRELESDCKVQCWNGIDVCNGDREYGLEFWLLFLLPSFLHEPNWCYHVSLPQMFLLLCVSGHTILYTLFKLLGDYVGLDAVFKTFQSLTIIFFPLENLLWHSVIVHLDDISCSSELGFKDQGFNIGGFCMVKDLKACDPILPFDAQDRAQALHVKVL